MDYPALSEMWKLKTLSSGKRGILSNGKSRLLYRTRQVFPVTLFPDEIVVEELRIVWIKQKGFWTNEVVSIMATDIASVNAASGPIFGHIHVQSLTGGPEILVDSLLRKDVYRIRSLVEGIALSAREGLSIQSDNLETEKESLYQAGNIN